MTPEQDAKKQKLKGQFIPLASADAASPHGSPLSESDIDEMVRNFDGTPVPVRFGRAKGKGPVVAKVTALQRDGKQMMGKFADVDSRFQELVAGGKLGGRAARSLAFERGDDETGKSLSEVGYHPPRVFYGGAWHDGPQSDSALDDLLDLHRGGDSITYAASDAGCLELVFPDFGVSRRQKKTANSAQTNSEKLHHVTLEYQEGHGGAEKVSYGDALEICARAHPELTRPNGVAPREPHPLAGYRFQTNSERLAELAKERQEERNLSFADALAEVVEDNPLLTLPESALGPLSPEAVQRSLPLSNCQKLHQAAKELQRKRSLSYGEALSRAAIAHPELTRG